MNTFKSIAYQILKDAGKPLHSKEIAQRAKKRGLKSVGRTPEKTMEAIVALDVKQNSTKSRFVRVKPSTFCINKAWRPSFEKKYKVSQKLSSKQKGDIAENRVAEIILMYGNNLSCYKPISDDEGIDLIVKDKKSGKVFFIQVKSVWRSSGVVVATVRKDSIQRSKDMGVVFCVFDTEEGEMSNYLWFIPARDFLKNRPGFNKKYRRYIFVAGKGQKETNRWNRFLIDKRDLANQVSVQMKRI